MTLGNIISKRAIIWAGVLVVGIGLIWFYGVSKKEVPEPKDNIGDVVPAPTTTPEFSSVVSPTPLFSQKPDAINKYPPAECVLTGSIEFISPGLYENKDANIIYKNIDSVARHIIWKVSPEDDLSVGPNLFANLPLPDGTEDITVGLPNNPKSKNYLLTAKVTYGVFTNKNLEIRESSCTGKIPVSIKY